jgi:hypothetical protein
MDLANVAIVLSTPIYDLFIAGQFLGIELFFVSLGVPTFSLLIISRLRWRSSQVDTE